MNTLISNNIVMKEITNPNKNGKSKILYLINKMYSMMSLRIDHQTSSTDQPLSAMKNKPYILKT